jgi:outer membrane protein W
MKKILTLLAMMATFSVYAQQEKGDLAIQFSGNYYSQRIKFGGETNRTLFGNIYIKMGKLFTPNLELGVKPNISFLLAKESRLKGDKIETTEEFVTNVGFGVYGTYAFLTADGKFLPYAGAELNYVPVQNQATINLGPYAGVKYFVSERVNIDANLSFLLNLGSTYEIPRDAIQVGPLFTYNVGVGVILGRLND